MYLEEMSLRLRWVSSIVSILSFIATIAFYCDYKDSGNEEEYKKIAIYSAITFAVALFIFIFAP